jgi:hypothetical protein
MFHTHIRDCKQKRCYPGHALTCVRNNVLLMHWLVTQQPWNGTVLLSFEFKFDALHSKVSNDACGSYYHVTVTCKQIQATILLFSKCVCYVSKPGSQVDPWNLQVLPRELCRCGRRVQPVGWFYCVFISVFQLQRVLFLDVKEKEGMISFSLLVAWHLFGASYSKRNDISQSVDSSVGNSERLVASRYGFFWF